MILQFSCVIFCRKKLLIIKESRVLQMMVIMFIMATVITPPFTYRDKHHLFCTKKWIYCIQLN